MDLFSYMLGKQSGGSDSGGGSGGGGGEIFPQKFYETDFVIEETVASGVVTHCTISTGLTTGVLIDDKEVIFAILTCEATDTSKTHWVKAVEPLFPLYGDIGIGKESVVGKAKNADGSISWRNGNRGVRISLATTYLSTLTIESRNDAVYAVAGKYHLELYRTGVNLL